ncbi:MAG: sigma-54-dependent Fis family transcriptional regulator, partial [Candidatus Cloacimonetes bacterium]|nr:sigma-54-dependent Fis family transcriptional regulator [Candidatus Cloacimonadota bacterium]
MDDEVTTCRETVKLLKRLGYESSYLLDLEKVERWITLHQPDILLLDVEFPGDMNGGINLLQALRRAGHLHPAIFLSHRGDSGTVVDASRQGMVTYLEKSASESALVAALEEAKGALPHRFDPDLPASEQVLGASAAFRETMQICRDFAPLLDIPVLLTGETGCGKNLTARLIHQLSPLCDKPFMELTCPTIPEGLAESHLFGHLKGSFTHAIADQKGIFELADGGTLFLDEFGDLKPDVQLKLLRVLDSGEYTVLGEHRTRHSRVRLIVATNQDIPAKIQNGEFRADLWHRIQGLELHLPPLRERSEDIALLANYFVA